MATKKHSHHRRRDEDPLKPAVRMVTGLTVLGATTQVGMGMLGALDASLKKP
jgi:hypothetical protein